jgi:DNA-binding transcriptional LysR family regulator
MMWQVRQLEAFQAVMAQGSITRAAETLHISQPAVSKLLSTLERNCGFKLFHRQGSRLTITSEGELLYAEVQRMMLSTEEIRRKAIEIQEQRFGTLNVAAFPALAARILPEIVSRFMRAHPKVRPLMTSRSSQFLVDWVSAQRSDIGIGLLAQERPGIEFRRLMQVEGVCVLPSGHRLSDRTVITPSDLDDEPFIALGSEDRTRLLIDQFFRDRNQQRLIVAETQMSEAACQLVANGSGVSIVEPFSTRGFSAQELLVKPINPAVHFDVWLMFPTYRPISKIATTFAYFLEAELHRYLTENNFRFVPVPLDAEWPGQK